MGCCDDSGCHFQKKCLDRTDSDLFNGDIARTLHWYVEVEPSFVQHDARVPSHMLTLLHPSSNSNKPFCATLVYTDRYFFNYEGIICATTSTLIPVSYSGSLASTTSSPTSRTSTSQTTIPTIPTTQPQPTPPSSAPVGAIVGGVIGGIGKKALLHSVWISLMRLPNTPAALALLILAIFFVIRKKSSSHQAVQQPLMQQMAPVQTHAANSVVVPGGFVPVDNRTSIMKPYEVSLASSLPGSPPPPEYAYQQRAQPNQMVFSPAQPARQSVYSQPVHPAHHPAELPILRGDGALREMP
jgi:hypothetical protein